MEDVIMKTVIRDFQTIMASKPERKDFIGGLVCVLVMMAMAYVVMVIFG